MKLICIMCASFVFLCASVFAQVPAAPAFEVASIKPLPPIQSLMADIQSGKLSPGMLGMRLNGARVDIPVISLSGLLTAAYKVKPHQIVGPDWLGLQLFEIRATLPEGASKDKVPEMLQTLLAERFKLVVHRENKELPIYALVVSKGGSKLKEAVEDVDLAAPGEGPAKTRQETNAGGEKEMLSVETPDGQVKMRQEGHGIVVSGGKSGQMRMSMGQNGSMSLEMSKVTMGSFADMLTQLVDRPVVDMTDLKGSYQVAMEIPMEELLNLARRIAPNLGIPVGNAGAGATGTVPANGLAGMAASDPSDGGIFQAVQQLGLKLDSRKAPVETFVIDNIERNPTEN